MTLNRVMKPRLLAAIKASSFYFKRRKRSFLMADQDPYQPPSFWTQRLARYQGLRGVGHVALSEAYNAWMYKARIRNLDWATRRFGITWANARVLDIGFGTGFFERYYQRHGVQDLLGIDVSTAQIEAVRQQFPGYTFKTLDASTQELGETEAFDIATCFAVIYHIVDDEKLAVALKNIVRALKPGGRFLLTGTMLMRNPSPERRPHYRVRRFEEVQQACTAQGLELEGQLPVTHFLNNPVDWTSPVVRSCFSNAWHWGVRKTFGRVALTGWPLGAALYALDGALLHVDPIGRSEKLTVWRKP